MANFTTHIAVGTVVSGGLATLTLAANVLSPDSLVAVTLAGVLGSVLPDIDLKESRPSRALFSGLAVFLSFCVLFSIANKYSIAEMWLVWLGTLFFVRYAAHTAFHHFSYHRGIWHSLLAGIFFWFVTAIVFKRLMGFYDGVAWLAGGFCFIGFVTHLILDEIYSVDVLDTRLKRSFGSALKFVDSKSWSDTAAVAIATILAFALTPDPQAFVTGISSKDMWAGLEKRMLPQDRWFGVIGEPKKTATAGPAVNQITTGAVKPEAPSTTEPPKSE